MGLYLLFHTNPEVFQNKNKFISNCPLYYYLLGALHVISLIFIKYMAGACNQYYVCPDWPGTRVLFLIIVMPTSQLGIMQKQNEQL